MKGKKGGKSFKMKRGNIYSLLKGRLENIWFVIIPERNSDFLKKLLCVSVFLCVSALVVKVLAILFLSVKLPASFALFLPQGVVEALQKPQ